MRDTLSQLPSMSFLDNVARIRTELLGAPSDMPAAQVITAALPLEVVQQDAATDEPRAQVQHEEKNKPTPSVGSSTVADLHMHVRHQQ